MLNGVGSSYVPLTVVYESVPIVCTGNGKAHTTPWFLAPCSKLCPKHLNTEIDSYPFIAMPNQKGLAVVVRKVFPAVSCRTASFFKWDTANLPHLGRPEVVATSHGAAMQFCLAWTWCH